MRSISILSVFVVVIPFIGLPSIYQTTFLVFVGVVIFIKSLLIERSYKSEGDIDNNLTFKQNEFPETKEDLDTVETDKKGVYNSTSSNQDEQTIEETKNNDE